jgi:hypothetical protein
MPVFTLPTPAEKTLNTPAQQKSRALIPASISVQRVKGKYGEAAELFDRITTNNQFAEFLTLPGYEQLD